MANYITIDSGTTNTRISFVKNLKIVETVKFRIGTKDNNLLKQALKENIAKIIARNKMSDDDIECILASGMITSEFGLVNLPHVLAPVGIKELHNTMQRIVLNEITKIPFVFMRGVKFGGETLEKTDVMRGEETEILGIYNGSGLYVLSGSHSKIVEMDSKGTIISSKTMLTGEMISALSQNTVLKNAVDISTAVLDQTMLINGFLFCRDYGINQALFKVRLLKTIFQKNNDEIYSFFLGAVLFAEIESLRTQKADKVFISGRKQIKEAVAVLLRKFSDKEIFVTPDSQSESSTVFGAISIYEYKD